MELSKSEKMSQEKKDRLFEMIEMRINGCTFQEIADKYGVSKQYVQQSITNIARTKRGARTTSIDMCVYSNLKMWMEENGIHLCTLNKILGKSSSGAGRIGEKLRGESDFKISEIKAILKESGKTFEYMFSTENEADN